MTNRDIEIRVKKIVQSRYVALDLGCGPLKKDTTWIGIDAIAYKGVDLVGDIFEILTAFPNDSVDEIYSSHFFEHIENVSLLLQETERILKPNATTTIIVPHFSNPYYYSDYTHKNFFGLYSFSYLVQESVFKRKVPNYNKNSQLWLKEVALIFKSPFPVRNLFFSVWGYFFNSCMYLKELYEEVFSKVLHCYELKFTLVKKQSLQK